jgi:serine/threonine protein kinase
MGEVYRARDTRLNRTVAIKVLNQTLSVLPELSERFDREAHAISQLTHPHICAVYDVGQQDGTAYFVMEYLEGESLEQRLKTGALPLADALKVAIDIADALAAAHVSGVVHRDLKPGNVMLTKQGAKLLDFGLAKTSAPVGVAANGSTGVATATNLTEQGTILGTVRYMAPEQLQGLEADGRTDIFAFGALVYEMITGRHPFESETQAGLIAAILERDPAPMVSLQPRVPPGLHRLVRACLAKSRDDRWQSARDLSCALRWMTENPSDGTTGATSPSRRVSRREAVAWTAAALLGIATAAELWWVGTRRTLQPSAPEVSFEIQSLRGVVNGDDPGFALSPDGTRLAFVSESHGQPQLFVRLLSSLSAAPLPGTTDAYSPFWSPDGRSIGFFANGALRRVSLDGGQAETVTTAGGIGYGGAWLPDGTIVFAPLATSSLIRVVAAGGVPKPMTTLSGLQAGHRHPFLMPDGQHVLFAVAGGPDEAGVYVAALDGSSGKRLEPGAIFPAFVAPDHLFFVRANALYVRTFDPSKLVTSGDPVRVAERVSGFSVSRNGVLAVRGTSPTDVQSRLVWVDRSGKPLGTVGPADFRPLSLELSRDEKRAVVHRDDGSGSTSIWLLDLVRGIPTRLTFERAPESWPVWSPNGSRVIFSRSEAGKLTLYEKSASGAEAEHALLGQIGPTAPLAASDWSSDGRFLLFRVGGQQKGQPDLFALPLTGDRKPFAWLKTPFDEFNGQFSPDARWAAYGSDETGRFEVYVQTFPTPTGKWQISTDGGAEPRWRADQKEIFYLDPAGNLMSVPLTVSPDGRSLESGTPVALFPAHLFGGFSRNNRIQYVPSADGQRFLLNQVPTLTASSPITVTVNWLARLKK